MEATFYLIRRIRLPVKSVPKAVRNGEPKWIGLKNPAPKLLFRGHAKPGMEFNATTFQFMRDYLDATEEEMANTSDVANFYYNMSMRFPEATLLRSNEMNSNVFKGGREWYYSDEEDGEER